MKIILIITGVLTAILILGLFGEWIKRYQIKSLSKERDQLDLRYNQERIKLINNKIDNLNGLKTRRHKKDNG